MPTIIFTWHKSDIQHNFVILDNNFLCWESEQLFDGTCVTDLCGTTIPPLELQLTPKLLPKTVPTLCHVYLFDHLEADGTGKVEGTKMC